MDALRLISVVLALAALLACGGERPQDGPGEPAPAPTNGPEPEPAPPPETPVTTKEPDAMESPEDYGIRVGEIYRRTLESAVEMMRGRPEPAALRPDIEKLKEEAIQELVTIGKAREAMPPADRSKLDATLRSELFGTDQMMFAAYTAGQRHYAEADRELGNLISSLNTLTQYAAFELLKKQLPEEAKRLGIE